MLLKHEILAVFRAEPSSEISWWRHLLQSGTWTIEVIKNEWRAACRKPFCLKSPLLISIHTSSNWSLSYSILELANTGESTAHPDPVRDVKHAPLLLLGAVTTDRTGSWHFSGFSLHLERHDKRKEKKPNRTSQDSKPVTVIQGSVRWVRCAC